MSLLALDSSDPEWDEEYQEAAERVHGWLRRRTELVLREVNMTHKPHSNEADKTYVFSEEQILKAQAVKQKQSELRNAANPAKINGKQIIQMQASGMSRQQIADAFGCRVKSIGNIRSKYVQKMTRKGGDDAHKPGSEGRSADNPEHRGAGLELLRGGTEGGELNAKTAVTSVNEG